MKSSLTIDVKEPCKENFANFNKTDKGGFCASCQKEVIDFTNFSDQELVRYLNSTSKKNLWQIQIIATKILCKVSRKIYVRRHHIR